jgi:hypothetical protein
MSVAFSGTSVGSVDPTLVFERNLDRCTCPSRITSIQDPFWLATIFSDECRMLFSLIFYLRCSSCMTNVFPIFPTAFFRNLGLGSGCSLLAGISIALMFVFYANLKFSTSLILLCVSQLLLQARSHYAD